MNQTLRLVISLALPLAVGATSGFFTITGVESWYSTIQKPSWNPPSGVFGPVWTTLYVMMGIALFLVWRSQPGGAGKKRALYFFAAQLTLNFFWSFIFFYLQEPGWAFAEIVILWLLILATIFSFSRVSRAAAWLLVPYISWVSFAAILNYTIWQLNR